MLLIVGLGNPGKKYKFTRHNIGRLIISNWQLAIGFPEFKFSKKFQSLISQGVFCKKQVILTLPETFMNNSGKGIKSLITNYQLPIANLWVVHDELDLPLGKIKIVKNRGAAGHKGVESIIKELGTKNFLRFRIGIKSSTAEGAPATEKEKFVLQKFKKREEKIVKEVIKKTCQAIETALKEGIEKAMTEFNK